MLSSFGSGKGGVNYPLDGILPQYNSHTYFILSQSFLPKYVIIWKQPLHESMTPKQSQTKALLCHVLVRPTYVEY